MDLHYGSSLSMLMQEPLGLIGVFPYGMVPISIQGSQGLVYTKYVCPRSACPISSHKIKFDLQRGQGLIFILLPPLKPYCHVCTL